MTQPPFFITTPIYYSNDIPHIGHAYSTFIADIIARDRRACGYDVRFSTWVDENSQKVVEKALEREMDLLEYVDSMAAKHRGVWDALDISYTDFVRTHHPSQTATVQYMLQKSFDNDDIYLGEYEGAYCVGCEAFKKPSDLTPDGMCPIHKKPVQFLKEKNYFFRLKKYEQALIEFYQNTPDFIMPENRRNEIVEFIKGGLEDFSVSREWATFGIALPFDPSHVTYVWYDALFNYVSIVVSGGDLGDGGSVGPHWPADVHVMGKDITRFHGIYWLAMLMSVGLDLPKKLLTTGYLTLNGEKMSKSLGNVVNPVEYIETYSRDLLVNYLILWASIGGDGDFSEEESVVLYNAHLANNFGNLVNRLTHLWKKVYGNATEANVLSDEAREKIETIQVKSRAFGDTYDLRWKLEYLFESARDINKSLDTSAPWKLSLDDEDMKTQYRNILWNALFEILTISREMTPYFPAKMGYLLSCFDLNFEKGDLTLCADVWVLFPRFESQNVTKKGENSEK